MEVGIDRKKVEERESAMRRSQLDGLVGYERIFSIICSLMYPRVPQKYSLKNSRIWSIRYFSSPPGPGDYVTSSASVPSNQLDGNNRVYATENCTPIKVK